MAIGNSADVELARYLEREIYRAFRLWAAEAGNSQMPAFNEVQIEYLPADQVYMVCLCGTRADGIPIRSNISIDPRLVDRASMRPHSHAEITDLARRLWSMVYDDQEVARMTASAHHAYEEARRAGAPGEWIQMLHERLQEDERRARQHLNASPIMFGMDVAAGDDLTITIDRAAPGRQRQAPAAARNMTATEVRARHDEFMRFAGDTRLEREQYIREIIGLLGLDRSVARLESLVPGGSDADKRGQCLLEGNLTPKQFKQYKTHKYFDVVGSHTGRTYRIHHGRQMNIYEIDAGGVPIRNWCFLPAGGLVAGDCMLAQKIALENDEHGALRVANLISGPRPRPTEYIDIRQTGRTDIINASAWTGR